jgi:hypothetical protein
MIGLLSQASNKDNKLKIDHQPLPILSTGDTVMYRYAMQEAS